MLDPCCGEGQLLDVFKERGFKTAGIELHSERAQEAQRRGHDVVQGDALQLPWPETDLLVTNPPFSLGAEFVEKALRWQVRQRIYTMLRLTFLEPVPSRRRLLIEQDPDLFILPERPAFDARGSDSVTSAWFRWPGHGRRIYLPPYRSS